MIIDFDVLSPNHKTSFHTTQPSLHSTSTHLASSYSFNHLTNSISEKDKLNKLSYTSHYQTIHKNQISTHSNHSYSSLFYSHYKADSQVNNQSIKTPKKFANLKTMQQMKPFIDAMDQAQLFGKPIYFNKQKQQNQKNQSQSLKNSLIKQKTTQKQNDFVQALTDRLYYNTERRTTNVTDACCKRKQCKNNISTIKKQEIQNEKQFTGQPQRQHPALYKSSMRLHRSLQFSPQKSVNSSFSTRSKQKDNVHTRLYQDFKERQIRINQIRKQIQLKSKSYANQLLSNPQTAFSKTQYEKNYRKFYDRLQELVQWHKNKTKIYQKLQLSNSFLNPNELHTKSKSKSILQSPEQLHKKMVILSTRNTKCSKIGCHEKQEQILRQLNKSRQKLDLNKNSVSIVQTHQKNMLQQIKKLFFNKKTGKIKVNSNKISQLSEFQFETFFKLIIQIEADSCLLKSEKMLQKVIIKFYQNLDIAQKQQLRRIHILNSCKKGRKNSKREKEQNLNEVKKRTMQINEGKFSKTKNISGVDSKYGVEGKDYWTNLIDFV